MSAAGLGHGFYYSLTNNFYLGVQGHYVQPGPRLPGQLNITQAEFEALALAQVTELWSQFGNLDEIWFDGGYTTDMKTALAALLKSKQPGSIGMNGGGISPNPVRWSKTEGDVPPGGPDVWSTACGNVDWGAGSPPEDCPPKTPAIFYPSGTDYTLQAGDVWFWEPAPQDNGMQQLRFLDELIYTYHQTVGHNTVLELDFAIDRHGQVEASHAALYKRFGDFLHSCYGTALAESDARVSAAAREAAPPAGLRLLQGAAVSIARVRLASRQVFDRVVLTEDQAQGQRVRAWVVEWTPDGGASWIEFGAGKSIGNKRIVLAAGAMSHNATDVRVRVTASVGLPSRTTLKVYAPCLTGTLDTITKLGTEDIGMTETTPVVWRGELYRFESVRAGNWNNTLNCTNDNPGQGRRCTSYLRFRRQSGPPEWKTGDVATSPFGAGWALACAIVDDEGGRIHAFASKEGNEIGTWSADGLTLASRWNHSIALQLPVGVTAFNTAVGKGRLPDGSQGYAMLIEVRDGALPGGFNIIVATASSLDGPWSLGDGDWRAARVASGSGTRSSNGDVLAAIQSPGGACRPPSNGGYCARPHSTPTHVAAGVAKQGAWPAPTQQAAEHALEGMCNADSACAAFGLGTDAKVNKQWQMYKASPAVLSPLPTPDWTLYYKNVSCCAPPLPPAPTPTRVFGPGSCPALRFDAASGYWNMLWTPNPTVAGGDYRTWQIYAARSKTLATGSWERSPLNPIMVADALDRQVHNTAIRADEQGWAANTTNLNDSDPDLVEFMGHVLLVGNWGDQRTTPTNSLFQAVFKGTMSEFWASLYPY